MKERYYLKYFIGKVVFATPIEEVKEIARPKEIIEKAGLAKNLAGYFRLRKQRILLFDLPGFLKLNSRKEFEVIVSAIDGRPIGFKVNKVLGIVVSDKLSPFPELVKPKKFLKGVIKDGKEFIQVLSFENLLSGSRLKTIKKYL